MDYRSEPSEQVYSMLVGMMDNAQARYPLVYMGSSYRSSKVTL